MSRVTMAADWTLDELRALLEDQPERMEGYRTMGEWARHLGISLDRARDLLTAAKSRGMMRLGHESREALDGRMLRTPVYSFEAAPCV